MEPKTPEEDQAMGGEGGKGEDAVSARTRSGAPLAAPPSPESSHTDEDEEEVSKT
jgi:hypothetical protein